MDYGLQQIITHQQVEHPSPFSRLVRVIAIQRPVATLHRLHLRLKCFKDLEDQTARDWNVLFSIYIYMYVYIYILICIYIYTYAYMNHPTTVLGCCT